MRVQLYGERFKSSNIKLYSYYINDDIMTQLHYGERIINIDTPIGVSSETYDVQTIREHFENHVHQVNEILTIFNTAIDELIDPLDFYTMVAYQLLGAIHSGNLTGPTAKAMTTTITPY